MIKASSRAAWKRTQTGVAANPKRNHIAIALLIGVAAVLGGASVASSTGALSVQLFSCASLIFGVLRLRGENLSIRRNIIVLGLGLSILVLLQLVPLPRELWTALPGRALAREGLILADIPLAPMPWSMAPAATTGSSLAVIPSLALLVLLSGANQMPVKEVGLLVIGLALTSWIVGVVQVAGGADSPLYFHAVTNKGLAVGFFANANHLATLLVVCAPLIAGVIAWLSRERGLPRIAGVAAFASYAGIAVLGVMLTSSVAGMVLLPLAIIPSISLIPTSGKSRASMGALSLIAGLLAAAFSVGVLGTNLGSDNLSRPAIWRTTLHGILQFWPLGSGLGTFQQSYRLFESPGSVTGTFINHAHNDYLEVLLEGGLPGAVLIALGLAWWGSQSLAAWRDNGSEPNVVWRRAASIVLGIVFAHSFVDYPLRTPALLTIATFYAVVLGGARPQPSKSEPQ